nr:serine/threonine-protein kinase [Haloferula luteola]
MGHYRLIDRLGEGGHGVVYLAEQVKPVRRKVALKIIRPGMDTDRVIARFEAERQALARMDHPNIARVLDAGSTSSGRLFFVMELVDGERVTDFCDARKLGVPQRLEIFMQVCQAIQHAHQKGIIHRDIKPSNLLVHLQDGRPVPKVIDFGIAKATDPASEDFLHVTQDEGWVGTPAYMSPEVAVGGRDVDTRSDIYSLGAVLAELLTGQAVMGVGMLGVGSVEEMRRLKSEEEVKAPSEWLAELSDDQDEEISRSRGLAAGKLKQRLKGDLDWIVLKAMAREPERRYESAYGLGLDIRRHLDHEVVSAGPPDPFYRFAKWVQRHRGSFLAGSMVGATLVVGLGVSTVLFYREKEARQEQARLQHETELARANEATLRQRAEYRERISHAAVMVSHGNFDAADQLLQTVPFGEAPASLEAAEAYLKLGDWHILAGRWEEATDYFANLALVLPSIDTADSYEVSVIVIPAAALLCWAEDLERYSVVRELAIERFSGTSSPVVVEQVFKACLLSATDRETLAKLEPMAAFLEKCLREGHPDLDLNDFRTSWACMSLGLMRYRQGNLEAAETWIERAVPIAGSHLPRQVDLACLLAMVHFQKGELRESEELLTSAAEMLDANVIRPVEIEDVNDLWYDWLVARIFVRETKRLMNR